MVHACFARGRVWGAAMLGWACAAPIHAGQSDFGVGLALTHTSNIERVQVNPQSEWTQALMAGLFYQENALDVTAHVLAQVERRHFVRQTNSDDTGGYLDGAAVWNIRPRQLIWTVEDVFRDVQVDIVAPNTPSNQAKSNSLSTGPDFTLPLSSTNSAVIGARYGRFDIENSITDNRRYTGYVRGVHSLSAQTKVSLNYEAVRVLLEPDAAAFPKVLREDWFGRYENRSVTNSTTIDLGTSKVTQYGGPVLDGQRLARLTLSQAFSPQATLRFALSDQISDTYTDLIGGVTKSTATRETGVVATGVNLATGEVYRSRRGDLAYVNDDGHFGYTLQAYQRQVDFETLDQDYVEKGGRFLWTWVFSGAMRFTAFGEYSKRNFNPEDPMSPVSGRQDVDRNFGAAVTYRVNANISASLQGGRTERQSTVPLGTFVDNRVMLVLGYSSGALYEVKPRR